MESGIDGYIIVNSVSHARYLPKPSTHSFNYPTISIFVDVCSLYTPPPPSSVKDKSTNISNGNANGEHPTARRSIGLGGLVFGTGSSSKRRLMNLRPSAYLFDDGDQTTTLVERFQAFMNPAARRGDNTGAGKMVRDGDTLTDPVAELRDVWLLTSPSYCGIEGINPLSVWFAYDRKKALRVVLLEVHNTFGERHVYVLRAGQDEDEDKPSKADHRWTIPRQFHVSPFNNRAGYYTCTLWNTTHPHLSPDSPRPVVRIDLLTPSRKLKLTATTRAVSSDHLSSPSILRTVLRYPFTLFLTMLRITYQAGILHYSKRLDVYPRPEPRPAKADVEEMKWSRNPVQVEGDVGIDRKLESGPVGWQPIGWIDQRAKERVYTFLSQRATELGVVILLRPANSHEQPLDFRPALKERSIHANAQTLTIRYLTPLFFTHLLVLPSATHALLLSSRTEKIFWTSNDDLFLQVFEPSPRTKKSFSQRLRIWYLPDVARRIPAPPVHSTDSQRGMNMGMLLIIVAFYTLERVERMLYSLFKARFVRGEEPWNGWERERTEVEINDKDLGSVRRGDNGL